MKKQIVQTQPATQALKDLACRAEWFDQLTAALQQIFFVATPDLSRILFMSPAYECIWGRSCAELHEDPQAWLLGIHPDDRERVAEFFETSRGSGFYETEYRVVRPDGTVSFVHDRSSEINGPDGSPIRVVGIVEDITERKSIEDELHEQRRKLQTLLSNLPGMAYRCRNDPDWTMEFISDGCVPLTGYVPEDLIGSRTVSYAQLIVAQDRQRVWDEVQQGINRHAPFQLLYRLTDKTGTEKWVWEQGRGVYDADGRLLALEGFITDVSDLKRAEQCLRDSQQELERRVAARTADLETSNQKLFTQYEITKVLAEAADVGEGVRGVLRTVCEMLGWDCGAWWTRSFGLEELRLGEFWSRGEQFPRFRASCQEMQFARGIGLPGRVWSSAAPAWIADVVQDSNFPRATAAAHDGLHAAFGFPVRAEGEVLGVVEFYTREVRAEDRSVLELLGFVGDLVGMFVRRKQAEARQRLSEEHLQAVVDGAAAVIYVKQSDGRYLLINREFEKLFHVRRSEFIGRTDHDVFPHDAAEAFRANDLQVIQQRRVCNFEETVTQDDGLHTYISIKFPLYGADRSVQGVCGISTDITERKRHEVELSEAREAADEANRAKSRFLANMSHEIRTPITAMLGAAELLPLCDQDPEERRRRTDMILRNGRHLLSLVDDLLEFSRIETGQLIIRPTRCSLPELLTDIRALADPLQRTTEVEFSLACDTPVPAHVYTDPTRLKQAAINLISNALKFTERGFVRVRVRCDSSGPGSTLSLIVEDSGVGIAAADLDRIFTPFIQGTNRPAQPTAGVGLGLTISRWIAERLGGSLTVESREGKGSRFTLRIEAGSLDSEAWIQPGDVARTAPQPVAAQASLVRLCGRILVAEDYYDAREVLCTTLSAAGAGVVAVKNGLEAVAACESNPFDLILMDIRMPDMDGLEAAAIIRKKGILTPMIALTASVFESDRHRILSAGFDDYWPKPVSMDFLLRGASAYLRSAPAEAAQPQPAPRRSMSPSERVAALAADFRRTLPKRIGELRAALAARRGDRAHHILHQLAGTCGMYGHDDLSAEAGRLLRSLRQAMPEDTDQFLEKMEAMVRQIRPDPDKPNAAAATSVPPQPS